MEEETPFCTHNNIAHKRLIRLQPSQPGSSLKESENMKLKEGNSVEVLRKENDLCRSWFSAEVIAIDGDDFIVRYKLLMDHKGEMAVERVCKNDIRPQPPHEKGERWIVGDIVEVFDIKCWKVGKVAKISKNNCFVIKFLGSIQLKEFHASNLRIRQVWHKNKWSVIEKVQNKNQNAKSFRWNNSKQTGSLVWRASLEASCEETCSKEKEGQKHLMKGKLDHPKLCLTVRTMMKSHACCPEPSSKDLLAEISCKRRKSNINVGTCDRPLEGNHWLFMQVDKTSMNKYTDIGSKMQKATSYRMHKSFQSTQCTEDSYQCSVASCSLNEFADSHNGSSQELGENVCDSSDAESSFPSLSGGKFLSPSPRHTPDADIHKLELQAYKSTLQVLYASGPLSWEQESLLTNLRLSLHISNEEHLLQLRHLLSAQVL